MAKTNCCIDCGALIWRQSTRCRPCKLSNARNSVHSFNCEQCGKEAHRRPGGKTIRTGAKNRWCSAACMTAWYEANKPAPFSPARFNTCKQCGKQWTAKRATSLCSSECGREYASADAFSRSKAQKVVEMRACKGCGTMFAPEYGNKRRKFCTQACANLIFKPPGSHWIRARYGMSAKEWARVRLMVFGRDQYVCHICGLETNPGADVNDGAYPHADHVVPVSKGGPTIMSNLRCSCRSCNMAKSDKTTEISL